MEYPPTPVLQVGERNSFGFREAWPRDVDKSFFKVNNLLFGFVGFSAQPGSILT